jgi:hypothetical protein
MAVIDTAIMKKRPRKAKEVFVLFESRKTREDE